MTIVRQRIRNPDDGFNYRLGVIVPIFDYRGLVLMGMPKKRPNTFTFVQGGADRDLDLRIDEIPAETIGREAGEEVGLNIPGNASFIAARTELMFEKFDDDCGTPPALSSKYAGRASYAAAYLLRPDAAVDISHSDAFSMVTWQKWGNAAYLTGVGHYLRAYQRLNPTFGLIPKILQELPADMSHVERLEIVQSKLRASDTPNLGLALPERFPRNDDYGQPYRSVPNYRPADAARVPAL